MLCMYQGFNLMSVDGKLKKDAIISKWSKHVKGELLNKLKSTCLDDKEDAPTTAWEFLKCQHKVGFSLYGKY